MLVLAGRQGHPAALVRDVGLKRHHVLAVAGIKRRDLAEMAGLTIETTVRLLKDFEERDVLRKKEKDLLILSEERLRALAGSAS